jgi:hypothetical protein
MLRPGLIRIDEEKVTSVVSDMSSETLRHVTHIIAVLTAAVLAAILIGTLEHLLLRRHNIANDLATRCKGETSLLTKKPQIP